MSTTLRLANRMILANTQDLVDPEERQRIPIKCGDDDIEAWIIKSESDDPEIFCLKFPGTGGRAERAGPHPVEVISDDWETWAINPPGYGTSTGKACVTKMIATCESAWQAICGRANGKPIVVTGNSLGCMYAIYVASRYPVAGLLVRNPAPLHQLIRARHSWWNFGLANRLIASHVPVEMDAVANATNCHAPSLFVVSANDKVVPPPIQEMVVSAYAGEVSTFTINDADHHTPVPEEQLEKYRRCVEAWGRRVLNISR